MDTERVHWERHVNGVSASDVARHTRQTSDARNRSRFNYNRRDEGQERTRQKEMAGEAARLEKMRQDELSRRREAREAEEQRVEEARQLEAQRINEAQQTKHEKAMAQWRRSQKIKAKVERWHAQMWAESGVDAPPVARTPQLRPRRPPPTLGSPDHRKPPAAPIRLGVD